MLGTGMPWHIILPFFIIGIVLGLVSAQTGRKRRTE